jgi:hypothetical protein
VSASRRTPSESIDIVVEPTGGRRSERDESAGKNCSQPPFCRVTPERWPGLWSRSRQAALRPPATCDCAANRRWRAPRWAVGLVRYGARDRCGRR